METRMAARFRRRPGLSEQEQLALKEFKRKLRDKAKDNLVFIKLFGSKARGESCQKKGDVDLFIVFKKEDRKTENILLDILCELEWKFEDVFFEVMTYSEDRYNRVKREQWPIILNIEKDGIIV